MAGPQTTFTAGYRWNIAARFLLAFLGGFVCVSTFGALAAALFANAQWMPLPQGVHVFTLFGFVAWCGIAMWVFFHEHLRHVALGVVGSAALFYALFLLVR